jgi:hypothetical protein
LPEVSYARQNERLRAKYGIGSGDAFASHALTRERALDGGQIAGIVFNQ